MNIKLTKIKTKTKTSLSNTFFRAVCIVALFLMALVFIPSESKPVYADATIDELNAQISALTIQLKQKKAEAKTFADEVAIFDTQIQTIQLQINATQAQINEQNSQITNINGKIADNEAKLAVQKEALKEQLKVIYENSNTSTLELIASSNSFSDFVDQTEYLQTMQEKTKDTIGQIKSLKQQLEDNKNNVEKKKKEIATLQKTQLNQKAGLDNQRYGKQMLLNQANSQGNQYQNSIQAKQAQIAKMKEFAQHPVIPPSAPPPPPSPPSGGGGSSGHINVPQVYQGMYPNLMSWSDTLINGVPGSTVAYLGCKLTSMVMIFQAYGFYITPGQFATDGRYFSGDLLIANGNFYGRFVGQTNYGTPTAGERSQAESLAQRGIPFIASANMYGWGPHSVVITREDSAGNWIMNDPISGKDKYFPMSKSSVINFVFVDPL